MSNEHEHCSAQPFEESQFRVLDKLRYHLFLCSDGKGFCGCQASGGAELLAALRREIVRQRLTARVKLTLMQCRQPGAAGPILVVYPEGIWYEGLTAANAAEFVDQQILRGEPVARFMMRAEPKPVTAVPLHVATPK